MCFCLAFACDNYQLSWRNSPLKSSSCLNIQKQEIPFWYFLFSWRREEDLNLRIVYHHHTISSRARSTTPPSLQNLPVYFTIFF